MRGEELTDCVRHSSTTGCARACTWHRCRWSTPRRTRPSSTHSSATPTITVVQKSLARGLRPDRRRGHVRRASQSSPAASAAFRSRSSTASPASCSTIPRPGRVRPGRSPPAQRRRRSPADGRRRTRTRTPAVPRSAPPGPVLRPDPQPDRRKGGRAGRERPARAVAAVEALSGNTSDLRPCRGAGMPGMRLLPRPRRRPSRAVSTPASVQGGLRLRDSLALRPGRVGPSIAGRDRASAGGPAGRCRHAGHSATARCCSLSGLPLAESWTPASDAAAV